MATVNKQDNNARQQVFSDILENELFLAIYKEPKNVDCH